MINMDIPATNGVIQVNYENCLNISINRDIWLKHQPKPPGRGEYHRSARLVVNKDKIKIRDKKITGNDSVAVSSFRLYIVVVFTTYLSAPHSSSRSLA